MGHVKQTVLVLVLCVVAEVTGSNPLSVCYFTSWSAQAANPNTRLAINKIDPSLCTHLVYAFAKLDRDSRKLVPLDASREDNRGHLLGLYAQFNKLKERNSKLKTLISVGGESKEISLDFAHVAKRPEWITKFAISAITFIRKRGFDGLDVDWEYPNATTKNYYTNFLKIIREKFDEEARTTGKPRLLLTVAVAAGEDKIRAGYDIGEISRFVDYIFIMTYDFNGGWSDVAGFNSPLKAPLSNRFSKVFNVDYVVQLWSREADKSKIVLGMTGAGASFQLNDSSLHVPGSPVNKGKGQGGSLWNSPNRLIYPEICMALNTGWKYEWDPEQQVPYAYKNDSWVGFDDEKSIRYKVKYALQSKIAGVMFWELSFDDPLGKFCNKGPFPLLHVVKKTLGLEDAHETHVNPVDPGVILLTKDAASLTTIISLAHVILSATVAILMTSRCY